ncbi:MAG: acylase [Bacteroidia bacterium]|nr:acylase [Bacteroidia bacterium]
MIHYSKFILFAIALIMTGCRTQQQVDTEVEQWVAQAENVTIIRDDFGVPHIYGKTDADAVFGLLYAQCEDDFPRVERNYVWAIGRLAEVEGEEAIYSDLRARLFMTKEEAITHYNNSPKWLRKLCDAWAAGINYYLHTNPEVQPKLLRKFEPWMAMYFTEGSIGGDIERISTRRIKAFYEDDKALSLNNFGNGLVYPSSLDEPAGSNGIAISGDHTASGNAMLLINPHTSFYFRGEVHVVSEEGLNAYGAVTWGQFFVYQGFNEKTGWIHTSTYTDVIDEFKETIEERDGQLKYKYGDEYRPLEVKEVTLKYKDGDTIGERTFPMYRTHHGPVTHKIGDQWASTALMWEPIKALEQSYIRTKKSGHEEFWEMMKMTTNSSNNTVYADADGNIAYYHGNFVPKRDVQFDYTQPVDGSNPATDWQGLHPLEETITVVNPPNGWIQNCNSTPFTSALEYSPKKSDYPRYMSIDRENYRGIHAIRLLSEVSDLTVDGFIELAYDPVLPAFEVLIPGLVEAIDQAKEPSQDMTAAAEVLRNWDFKTSVSSVAMTLAHYYGSAYGREGEAPDGVRGMALTEYYGKESPMEERLNIFTGVIEKLNTDFGTWNKPWGEVHRFQRLTGDIDLKFDDDEPSIPVGLASGRWGALAAYGMRGSHDNKKIYGTRGNSFVAVVEFGDKVKAKSILAGGQSGDPDSPHFFDQAQPYADINFKDVAYYREDVEARAKKTYRPGE